MGRLTSRLTRRKGWIKLQNRQKSNNDKVYLSCAKFFQSAWEAGVAVHSCPSYLAKARPKAPSWRGGWLRARWSSLGERAQTASKIRALLVNKLRNFRNKLHVCELFAFRMGYLFWFQMVRIPWAWVVGPRGGWVGRGLGKKGGRRRFRSLN